MSRPGPLPDRQAFPYSGLISGFVVLLSAAARLLAFLLYAVLATLAPLVRALLLLLAIAGLLTCVVYRFLVHDPHFPFWTMLIFSISMCALSGAYDVLLRWLSRA
jgi:hypothetical protein